MNYPVSPPPPDAVRSVTYPQGRSLPLANGLTVVSFPDFRLPRVTLGLGLPVGRAHGPSHNLALLPLTIEMLTEGTRQRRAVEIAEEMDFRALSFSADVLMEATILSLNGLEQHFESAMELLAELLTEATFPPEQLDKMKARWHSSLLSQRTQPAFLAKERIHDSVFGPHPYRRVSVPIPQLLEVGSEELAKTYQSFVVPQGATLVVAGAVEPESAFDAARKILEGRWQRSPVKADSYASPAASAPATSLVHRPNSVQARVVVAGLAPASADPERMAFRVANQVIGGGASSRLFLELRERRGLTYGAYSNFRSYRQAGIWTAAADVRSDAVAEVVEKMLEAIQLIQRDAAESEELQRSKAELIGSFVRTMETASALAGLELKRRLNGLPEGYYERYIPEIDSTSADDVLETSKRYFCPESTWIAVVGDAGQLEEKLKRWPSVEVWDGDGNRLG